MMNVEIRFSNLLAEKIGNRKIISFPGLARISIAEFIVEVEKETWSSEILENGHIKNPVILIIDNDLIQISSDNTSDKFITENSEITFQIMFAGG